jgi:hypothetical protein
VSALNGEHDDATLARNTDVLEIGGSHGGEDVDVVFLGSNPV